MSKENNLGDLLKSVADSIRKKKGTESLINPQNFDAEIESIHTGTDISGVTAQAGDVLKGKFFVSNDGQLIEGTVPDQTKVTEIELETGTEPQYVPSGQYSANQTYLHLKDDAAGIIKAGETILGTQGTFKGVDTADANATAEDILSGKTAYAQGEKITGNILTYNGETEGGSASGEVKDVTVTENGVTVIKPVPGRVITRVNLTVNVAGGGTNKQAQIISKTITELDAADFAGVTEIARYAFYDCLELTSVVIPANVKTVAEYAFASCRNMSDLTLSNGLEVIGEQAFGTCPIEALTVPASVTTIGDGAFGGGFSLTSVTVLASTPPALGANAFENNPALTSIKVPASSVEQYKAAANWSAYADIITAI